MCSMVRIHGYKILFCSLQFFSGITCPGTVPFHEKNAIHDFLLTTNHRWHAQISPAARSRFFYWLPNRAFSYFTKVFPQVFIWTSALFHREKIITIIPLLHLEWALIE